MVMPQRPRIGVSACLLGHKVRYDGKSKPLAILDELALELDLVPLCPETAIGLPVPRPAMRLQQTANGLRILGIADPNYDATERLKGYADKVSQSKTPWAGFILKSRSPSCGLGSTPIYSDSGTILAMGDGAFANQLSTNLTKLPIIDELAMNDAKCRKAFMNAVLNL